MAAIDFGSGPDTPTGDTVAQALAKLQARFDAQAAATVITRGVVYDGDSITEGPDQSWLRAVPSRPSIFTNITGLVTQNLGVSQKRLQELDATFGSRGLAALYNASSSNTLLILAGINDILNQGATLAQLKGCMTSYCSKAVGAGFRSFAGTILPTSYQGWTSGMETIRNGFNAWIQDSTTTLGLSGVSNYAAIPEAQNTADVTYYADLLHPTVRLLGIMSRLDASMMGVPLQQFVANPNFTTGIGGWFGYSYNFSINAPFQPDQGRLSSPAAGRMRITVAANATYPEAHIPVSGLVPGATYTLSYDLLAANGAGSGQYGARVRIGNAQGESILTGGPFAYSDGTGAVKTVVGTYTGTFTAAAATHFFVVQNYAEQVGGYIEIDNVKVVKTA